MNISALIQGFSSYLEGLNEVSSKEYNTESSNVSIFMYSSEFKNYLADELNIDDTSIFSKSINEILSMDVVNGKLVDASEENSDSFSLSNEENETEETATLPQNTTSEQTNNTETSDTESATDGTSDQAQSENLDILTGILNNIFKDNTVISALDSDGSGDLDKDEISSFLNSINSTDGNANNLSLEDILAGIEQVKQQTDNTETNEETETKEVEETQGSEAATNSSSSTPSGTSSGSSSSGSFSSPTSSSSNEIQEKSLDNMTKEELNDEKTTAEAALTEKQDILSSLYDGSEENLQRMNEEMENLYDTYLEELETIDKDMAEQVDSLKQDIDSKQDEIDSKDQEIADQEGVVSSAETAYNNAVSNTQQLEASLSSLESTDTSNMDDSQIADLNSKIAELESKITESKQAEDDAKQAWDDAEKTLESLNKERDALQENLDDLNTQMTELEAQILEQYPQIKESLDAYNEAKELRDSYKSEAVSAIKSEIQTAQNYVNDIDTAINKLDNKEVEKEYSINSGDLYDAEEGENLVDYAKKMLSRYGSSTGYCATGVSRTFAMAYGIQMGGNGCDWDTNMEKLVEQGMFAEVTDNYASSSDLSNLPAGAVVCWEATGGTSGGGAQYGHVTIADGNGGEISDHYAPNIYKSVGGRSDTYRVFIPV